jgi:hypothetical protein
MSPPLKADQPSLDVSCLVSIDETVVTTKKVRLYGRAPGHWKTLTLVAALRVDGVTAPYVIDGAMDGPALRRF